MLNRDFSEVQSQMTSTEESEVSISIARNPGTQLTRCSRALTRVGEGFTKPQRMWPE
jgi:hypothetical protein